MAAARSPTAWARQAEGLTERPEAQGGGGRHAERGEVRGEVRGGAVRGAVPGLGAVVVPEAGMDGLRDAVGGEAQAAVVGERATQLEHGRGEGGALIAAAGRIEAVADQGEVAGDRDQLAGDDAAAGVAEVEHALVDVDGVQHRGVGVEAVVEVEAGVEGHAHAQDLERIVLDGEDVALAVELEHAATRGEPGLGPEAGAGAAEPGLIPGQGRGDRPTGVGGGEAQQISEQGAVSRGAAEVEAQGVAPGGAERGRGGADRLGQDLAQQQVEAAGEGAGLQRLAALRQAAQGPAAIRQPGLGQLGRDRGEAGALGRARVGQGGQELALTGDAALAVEVAPQLAGERHGLVGEGAEVAVTVEQRGVGEPGGELGQQLAAEPGGGAGQVGEQRLGAARTGGEQAEGGAQAGEAGVGGPLVGDVVDDQAVREQGEAAAVGGVQAGEVLGAQLEGDAEALVVGDEVDEPAGIGGRERGVAVQRGESLELLERGDAIDERGGEAIGDPGGQDGPDPGVDREAQQPQGAAQR